MKKGIRNTIILLSPFLLMVTINELTRISHAKNNGIYKKIETINSSEKRKNKCTWACHKNTNFCKENHVKKSKTLFKIIDPIYFGIIQLLKSTGNYILANIIFLVILFPSFIYFLLLKNIDLRTKINSIKNA